MSKKLTIASLGPEGTHTQAAAKYLFADSNIKLFPTIAETIEAIDDSDVDLCVVPIENSLEGSVNVTLDNLNHKQFCIVKELIWPIRHHLMSLDNSSTITTILSHPQALAQSRGTLHKLYPDAKYQETSSTAEAAQIASKNANIAAISPYSAASTYNLTIRNSDVQDSSLNCTRFIVVAPTSFVQAEADATKISLVCELDGEKPGSLYELLQDFALNKINLVRIESRPAKTILGRYLFFLDLEGSTSDPAIKEVLDKVSKKTLWLRILGSYPVLTAQEKS